jgi:hippurate hydrolase
VELELTLRSYSDEVKVQLIEKIKRICIGNAQSAGIPEDKYPEFWIRPEDTPSLYNDPELTSEVSTVLAEKLGEDRVVEVSPVMAGEDFSEFGRTEHKVPVCLLWLGAVAPEKIKAAEAGKIELPSLHSAKFAPMAEPAIKTGVEGMSAILLHLLNK